MSVYMMPGSKLTIAIPSGTSFAVALLSPSTAHFDAQYGAHCKIQGVLVNKLK